MTIDAVLLQSLTYKTLLALSEIIVLAALKINLLAYQLLLIQARVLLKGTQLAIAVHVERGFLRAVVEPVLLHGHLRVAQQILLFGKFSLSIKNLQVQIAVAQSQYHVAFLHASAFLNNLFSHDASLFRRYLHHLDGHHLSVKTHIVVKLATCDIAHRNVSSLYGHRARRAAEDYPCEQRHHCHRRRDIQSVTANE